MKIYHTADVHIGLKFSTYSASVSKVLVDERFGVLERMVNRANEEGCDFFVVAGDLFDSVSIPDRDVKRAIEILRLFSGQAVLLLAGNHDYCRDHTAKPWSTVLAQCENSNIYPLIKQGPRSFEVDGQDVVFYACPCPDRTSAEHQMGWVAAKVKSPNALHIGIAHGNVEGLSLDDNHAYYTMKESELRQAGCTTWLLGHVHVPFPTKGISGTPTFFMSGAPTPDTVRMSHPGHAWIITFDANGNATYKSDVQASITFKRITQTLTSEFDLRNLQQMVNALPLSTTVLDLQLGGALEQSDIDSVRSWLAGLDKMALHVSCDSTIKQKLTAQMITSEFPDGTLPHAVLSELLLDADHTDDAHIAYEILKGGAK